MGSIEPMVSVAGRRVPLAEFIADCLDQDEELVAARLTFLAGGLDALRTAGASHWTELSLGGVSTGVYPVLRDAVDQLLGDGEITEFLLTHRPPGLRVGFAAAPGRATRVRAEVRALSDRWRRHGLVAEAVPDPAVLRPRGREEHLFGGPDSLRHAYRLFTVDSVIWLHHHSDLGDRTPSWVVSLRMLRAVFDGLRIDGWEDRDVWTRVREILGLPESSSPSTDDSARWWAGDQEVMAKLPAPTRALLDRHAERVAPVLASWWDEYFATEQARVGPREAAAYHVVHHWNRARLGPARRASILDALVGHRAD